MTSQRDMRRTSAVAASRPFSSRGWFLAILLILILCVLFWQSFLPHFVLFSNDGPLGQMAAVDTRLPGRFTGTWHSLSWLGSQGPAAALTVTTLSATIFSPMLFLKIYAPMTLMLTGLCAWFFFRQLRLSNMACVLGGLAAALNMHFFSVACWGQGSWDVGAAMAFLALSAIVTPSIKQLWGRAILAGLATGMVVMESFDTGAILSVFIGGFILFHALTGEGAMGRRILRAVASEFLVVVFALFIASHTISTLVTTQVEGISGNKQDVQTRESRWVPATRWSLPKLESIEVFIPGVFGYRTSQHIDTPDHSSAYWGSIGEDPKVPMLESPDPAIRTKALDELNAPDEVRREVLGDDPIARHTAIEQTLLRSGASRRFTGTGEYAGIAVSLLALFGLLSVFRREGNVFSTRERIEVGFWGGVALIALMASWGRFFFVYHWIFQLPYVSTIRNPIKFLHPFQVAWVILAAYGAECLYRLRSRFTAPRTEFLPLHILHWFKRAARFEKNWTIGLCVAVAFSVIGWFMLGASHEALVEHLLKGGFPAALAQQIAEFNSGEILWFVVLFAVSAWIITAILSGAWAGNAVKWGAVFLGVVLVFDLGRADSFWVHYQDSSEKLSLNPVTEFLSDKPYEHRVIGRLEPFGPGSGITQGFGQLYYVWLQNDFPYHSIEALDFAQMPRVPDRDRAFGAALKLNGNEIDKTDLFPAVRMWQLTNTRYILGPAPTSELMNDRVPEAHHSMRVLSHLNIVSKPNAKYVVDYSDSTVDTSDKGPFALMEYGEALPRAKLYSNWQQPTNDDPVLPTLASKDFDPMQSVIVDYDTPVAKPAGDPKADPGTVTITGYLPKRVQLEASVKTPAVLLLNDRFDPEWNVFVDGTKAPLLRCNYLMRGVYLTPGEHKIDFRFQMPLKTLYLNILALVVGIAVSGFLFVTNRGGKSAAASASATTPASPAPSVPKSAPSPQPRGVAPAPAKVAEGAAPVAKNGAGDRSKNGVKQKTRR